MRRQARRATQVSTQVARQIAEWGTSRTFKLAEGNTEAGLEEVYRSGLGVRVRFLSDKMAAFGSTGVDSSCTVGAGSNLSSFY
jgi:hypothetical protein